MQLPGPYRVRVYGHLSRVSGRLLMKLMLIPVLFVALFVLGHPFGILGGVFGLIAGLFGLVFGLAMGLVGGVIGLVAGAFGLGIGLFFLLSPLLLVAAVVFGLFKLARAV